MKLMDAMSHGQGRGVVAVLALGIMAGLMWVPAWAQDYSGGETGNMLQDLWTMAKNASPPVASFCIYLWLGERGERRKLQAERDGLLERVINAVHTSATSTENIANLFERVRSN